MNDWYDGLEGGLEGRLGRAGWRAGWMDGCLQYNTPKRYLLTYFSANDRKNVMITLFLLCIAGFGFVLRGIYICMCVWEWEWEWI